MKDPDFVWRLPPGRVLRLPAVPVQRRVAVLRGQLWLTRRGDPADHWLAAGTGLTLAAGESAVIEAWPEASFQVLLPRLAAPAPARLWLPRRLQEGPA